jgi:hypothetical protein
MYAFGHGSQAVRAGPADTGVDNRSDSLANLPDLSWNV